MPLSERSKARVQLEASFFTSMAAHVAVVGSAIPLGFYFFEELVRIDVSRIILASLACFAIAVVLHLIGAAWLMKLEER